jgi:hypothetical protein
MYISSLVNLSDTRLSLTYPYTLLSGDSRSQIQCCTAIYRTGLTCKMSFGPARIVPPIPRKAGDGGAWRACLYNATVLSALEASLAS